MLRLQVWAIGLALRGHALEIVGSIACRLLGTVLVLLAVLLFMAAFSGREIGGIARLLPAAPSGSLDLGPSGALLAAAALMIASSLAGIATAAILTRLSERFEQSLRRDILANAHILIAPRSCFAAPRLVEKRIGLLVTKVRAVVRCVRAQASIVPALVSLALVSGLLVSVFPVLGAVMILALVGVAVFQRYYARIVAALEVDHEREAGRAKAALRPLMASLRATPGDPGAALDRAAPIWRAAATYFRRYYLSVLANYLVAIVLTAISAALLLAYLHAGRTIDSNLLLEIVALFLLGRLTVTLLSGLSANLAVIAKYAYHARPVYTYFRTETSTAAPPPGDHPRLIGLHDLDRYSVSFYADALLETAPPTAGTDGRIVIAFDGSNMRIARRPGADGHWHRLLPVASVDTSDIELEPGDLVALHGRIVAVRRRRRISTSRLGGVLRWDLKRTARRLRARPSSADDDATDEDADGLGED